MVNNNIEEKCDITIRRAHAADIDAIVRIYDAIHDAEEQGRATIGWIRGVYPVRQTAVQAVTRGDMYVMDDGGAVVAAAIINQQQVPAYRDAHWATDAPDSEVLVLHTLTVDPHCGGRGYGKRFVHFYEALARQRGCTVLRMDTNARNTVARRMYRHLGYQEADIVPTVFNGIPDVMLVCLEKRL